MLPIQQLPDLNAPLVADHEHDFDHLQERLGRRGVTSAADVVTKLRQFQVAVPSWVPGTGGTRFSRFPGGGESAVHNPAVAYMIDASHNTKDPLEDRLQSTENILTAYAKALLVDHAALEAAQQANDAALAEDLLRDAFLTDVRPLVAGAYRQSGGARRPVTAYRQAAQRAGLIQPRSLRAVSPGL